ncbi:MAG: hypothetical protein REI78_02660 [Pedobacter sp.]|nr:hypothetical protein [Pedobacter sp.]
MKYHYQYVSPRSVRIELIAIAKEEDEINLIYSAALSNYSASSIISKINFMDFPKVALISFEHADTLKQALAV